MDKIEVKKLNTVTDAAMCGRAYGSSGGGLIDTVRQRYRIGLNSGRAFPLSYMNKGRRNGDADEENGIRVMDLIRPHLTRRESRLRGELQSLFTKRHEDSEKKIRAKFVALDREREKEEREAAQLRPDERLITRGAAKKIMEDHAMVEEDRLREIIRENIRPVAGVALRRLKEDDEYERMRRNY